MFLQTIQGVPRVSHRVIATNTDNQARNIKELVDDNMRDFEDFGIIRFETEKTQTQGRPQQIYYLNEPQATLLLTYLRNSDIVKKFKKALVKEFYKLRDKQNKPRPKLDNLVNDFGALQQKLNEIKSEANTFRQKYYEALERENKLLKMRNPSYIKPMPRYSEDEETIVLTKAKKEDRFYVGSGNALRPSEVETIMELYLRGIPQRVIAKTIGRSESAVGRCVRRHR